MKPNLLDDLIFLYGEDSGSAACAKLMQLMAHFQEQLPADQPSEFSERDTILITYGDQLLTPGEAPLSSLAKFCDTRLNGLINTIHILPFYPFSSDDGFSVIDYKAVHPDIGSWEDIAAFRNNFHLMFDAVINHISAESAWFQAFLRGEAPYRDYFITLDPDTDLSAVFRPRALPLLTEVKTRNGPRHVWTTFSADQIDLNFANPELLLEIIDLILFYVKQGANLIRLDAIAFMWKEVGTSCIHLPQTHRIIQLIRSVLDVVAPSVVLITETNVPHEENISYFGNGQNEAQMVYNFSLPPLTLHAFYTGNAEELSRWATSLTLPSNRVTFFNFLASHDGIGLTPVRGLLPETAVTAMAARVQQLGGFVSFKNNPDGTQSPYELNINYLDALGKPEPDQEPFSFKSRRFLASQAIMLALRGVPGIYFHSLFGSRGWPAGAAQTGRNRTINRQKLEAATLTRELDTPGTLRHHVFNGYRALLRARTGAPAFHPNGPQEILFLHPALFSLRRTAADGSQQVLCLHNVSDREITAALPGGYYHNLITKRPFVLSGSATLQPYQILWLEKRP